MDSRIAIVGIGGVFPASTEIASFWKHILAGQDLSSVVPKERWAITPDQAYDPTYQVDKVYSKRACLVDPFKLDCQGLDVDPNWVASLDPLVSLLLHAGREAWADAQMEKVDRSRVGVLIGNIALPTDGASQWADELFEPIFDQQILGKKQPATNRSNPLNRYVTGLPAGILARALGLGASSYTLDAACASSLYALKFACDELRAHRADAMLAGGLSRPDCLYTQMGFSQLHALSASGHCSPFDQKADGLVVGEGSGLVVLKRLDDALRDGDHIYATIAGIGLSNDIHGNLMSPDSDGQLRAMRDAYQQAKWKPDQIDLIECHGTGTPVGDAVEFKSLCALWSNTPRDARCVIGSVKSNVGHLLTAAGAAGLIKVLLAMRDNQLPPTANFTSPSSGIALADSPFEVLSKPKDWLHPKDHPRRAAVSAFGFGGINAHVLLEAFEPEGHWSKANQFKQIKVAALESKSKTNLAFDVESKLKQTSFEPLVIVGMAAHVGPWKSLDQFAHRVLLGQEITSSGQQVATPTPAKHWWGMDEAKSVKGYFIEQVKTPIGRFRIPPAELKEMLPQQLLMLNVAADALADAKISFDDPCHLRSGVFIGIGLDLNTTNFHLRWTMLNRARKWAAKRGVNLDEKAILNWTNKLRDAVFEPLTANRTMGALGGIVASRVARAFRVGGPSFTISSEETSSLRALEAASRALQLGEIDQAIVGGVDLAGDVRAALGYQANRPLDARGQCAPLDQQAKGAVVADGAAAIIVKRQSDALRDGDRIYAELTGFGAAISGKSNALTPTIQAYRKALKQACDEAGLCFSQLNVIETHGSADPKEDAVEAQALAEIISSEISSSLPKTISRVKSLIGHTGAASGLCAVVAQTLALYYQTLGPQFGLKKWCTPLAQQAVKISASTKSTHWLYDKASGPRSVAVMAMSVDGNVASTILRQADVAKQLLQLPCQEQLFVVEAETTEKLIEQLEALRDKAANNNQSWYGFAKRWHDQTRQPDAACAASLFATDVADLQQQINQAKQAVRSDRKIASDQLYYTPSPLGKIGEVAFVFPGAGNQFLQMGRDIALRWPGVAQKQNEENDRLASQFGKLSFWTQKQILTIAHRDVIFGQVWLGALVSDVLAQFGLKPKAAIGYSLGETTAQFALRSWTQRDLMLHRMEQSSLFTEDLAGSCAAAKKAWHLADDEKVDWRVAVVTASSTQVKRIIKRFNRAYLLIINSPNECVIGGDLQQIDQVIEKLNVQSHLVQGVTTVHCEVAKPVAKAYHDLHLLETTPPKEVRFYSSYLGKSYQVTRESIATSILNQAVHTFDFSKVINAAYDDGVRLFIEVGPGSSCTRMIKQTLGEKKFVAQAACVAGQDSVKQITKLLAQLVAERVCVDMSLLFDYVEQPVAAKDKRPQVVVPVGGKPIVLPPLPTISSSSSIVEQQTPSFAATKVDWTLPAEVLDTQLNVTPDSVAVKRSDHESKSMLASVSLPLSFEPMIKQMAQTEIANAQAQEAFLELSRHTTQTLSQAIATQMTLLQSGSGDLFSRSFLPTALSELPAPPTLPVQLVTPIATREIAFDRAMCMTFAVGAIGQVLGEKFALIDTHPTRVRLPDEPLMLVDRMVKVEGEPASMTSGRVVTEHDILPHAWYLDHGRIPTCIAVEAGQADLFLSAYLGIDFHTQGKAVYRLLDAIVTFHQSLPKAGKTIVYDIHIDEFFKQDQTYLFRFHFEATVDGQLFLTMREGCAGFFTQEELAAGKGIVQTKIDCRPMQGKSPSNWKPPIAIDRIESYSDQQLKALRVGDLQSCFGDAFAGLPLTRPSGLPDGKMTLVHRILSLDPTGGRYGIGQIVGEADIHPDDWFLTCHFVDDRVMPGTLMYECCLHTLRVYLLRMGWVGEFSEMVYEPIPSEAGQLKCRGQVLETTRKVTYEITLKEIGFTPATQTPYVLADALMYGDGKPIVQMKNMSLRLTGLTRQRIDDIWQQQNQGLKITTASDNLARPNQAAKSSVTLLPKRKALFDQQHMLAFTEGKPSQAFGDRYRIFDDDRRIARLPRSPYAFLDRIVSIENCQPWVLEAGAEIVGEYDVPTDAWYFSADRQGRMPFAILLEVALQPCGWLAAYLGSALTSDIDLSFRNLGGVGKQMMAVEPDVGTLSMSIKMTSVSQSGGMIIQHYSMDVTCAKGCVYQGTTYFGFFSKASLAEQVGIRDAKRYQPTAKELAVTAPFDLPNHAPFPDDMMRMADRVVAFDPEGGPSGLGFIRGETLVKPEAWFFQAHFYQDPVWPGSLGLESFVQLLKVVAVNRWGESASSRFEALANNFEHRWVYRGQIIPKDKQVIVDAVVKRIDDADHTIVADGFLIVDGRIIYQMINFAVRMNSL